MQMTWMTRVKLVGSFVLLLVMCQLFFVPWRLYETQTGRLEARIEESWAGRLPVPDSDACGWGLRAANITASCDTCNLYYDPRPGSNANGACVYVPNMQTCMVMARAVQQGLSGLVADCDSPAPKAIILKPNYSDPARNFPRAASIQEPVFFWHVPKNGGSSMRMLVERLFPSEVQIIPCYGGIKCTVSAMDLNALHVSQLLVSSGLLNRTACATVFAGHFKPGLLIPLLLAIDSGKFGPVACHRRWVEDGLGVWDVLRRRARSITVLREPVARTISHYNYFIAQLQGEATVSELLMRQSNAIRDIVARTGGSNLQVGFFSDGMPPNSGGDPLLRPVDVAAEFLKYCTVGFVEHLHKMFALLGIKGGAKLRAGTHQQGCIPNVHLEALASNNLDDGLLYAEQARSLLNLTPACSDVICWPSSGMLGLPHDRQLISRDGIFADCNSSAGAIPRSHVRNATRARVAWNTAQTSPGRKAPEKFMVKAVTYFGSATGSPVDWWQFDRLDNIDKDFMGYVLDGFNTIIIVIPWSGVQVSVVPVTYDDWMLARLRQILDKAVEHQLRVIARVGYPHDFNPLNSPRGDRCEFIMTNSSGFMEGWLDYLATLNSVFTAPWYKTNFLYSFLSWEDFFCLLPYPASLEGNRRTRLAYQLGFADYVRQRFGPRWNATVFGEEHSIKIPKLGGGLAFEAWIDFIDTKWWELVEKGRSAHPQLTMEIRIETEPVTGNRGGKQYDMHYEDKGPPRQAYWAPYYNAPRGKLLSANEALTNLEKALKHASEDGAHPVVLSQFNFLDNTPHFHNLPSDQRHAKLILEECKNFLVRSAELLNKYTTGYGLWTYRGYRQSEIFNGAFMRGLAGWKVNVSAQGSVSMAEDGFLLMQANGGFAGVAQGVKQTPQLSCDNRTNDMQLCFRHLSQRGHSALEIMWNQEAVRNVPTQPIWTSTCTRLPAKKDNAWYLVGFRVRGADAVKLDAVQYFCHTHIASASMHSNCQEGILKLNQLL